MLGRTSFHDEASIDYRYITEIFHDASKSRQSAVTNNGNALLN